MRATYSMSAGDIQSFLGAQTGILESLVTTNYAGQPMTASAIIYQACQNYGISPRVILTMLQKEQSLLTRTTLTSSTLTRALGAGCPDKTTNYYPGFGKQVWYAAWLLSNFGEVKAFPSTYVNLWAPGMTYQCGASVVTPENLATYKLYVYNPSVEGNNTFWSVYAKYFGDPLAGFVPAKVKLTAASAGYASIKLSWPSVSGATGYSVYRATSSGGTYSQIASATATTFTDASRTTGKTYYYKVRASRTDSGTVWGNYSSVQSAKAVPTKVTLTAASAGYRSIKLSWTAVAGATRYEIYRATSAGGTYVNEYTLSGTSHPNGSRTTGKTYYYKVRAYHLEGSMKVYGSFSAVKSARAVPAKVTGLKLAKASSTSVGLKWSSVSGATGYAVYRATSSSGTYTKIASPRSASYKSTGLTRGKTYWYKVRAYHLEGSTNVHGAYSSVGSMMM
jgi:fibronectin type 3 domain-containing protein